VHRDLIDAAPWDDLIFCGAMDLATSESVRSKNKMQTPPQGSRNRDVEALRRDGVRLLGDLFQMLVMN